MSIAISVFLVSCFKADNSPVPDTVTLNSINLNGTSSNFVFYAHKSTAGPYNVFTITAYNGTHSTATNIGFLYKSLNPFKSGTTYSQKDTTLKIEGGYLQGTKAFVSTDMNGKITSITNTTFVGSFSGTFKDTASANTTSISGTFSCPIR